MQSNRSNELVVQEEKWLHAILGAPAILIVGVFILFGPASRTFFQTHVLWGLLVGLCLLFACYLLIRSAVVSKIRMVIGEDGIWVAKYGTYYWSTIDFCYFSEVKDADGGVDYLFFINLFGSSANEVRIVASYFNQSERRIKAAIEANCGDRIINVVLSADQ
jgi:hypothetical protein